jgi:HAE1 family hydrophobic/amphiphilic exporter-1
MAVAIIGGTITSTILTLLVVPTFYDSIEIARDRAFAKFHVREARWNAFSAFVVTFAEALLALTGVRMLWRGARKGYARLAGRRGPRAAEPVAGD